MTPVERVARAIWAAEYTSPWPAGDGYPDNEERGLAIRQARAAIEALREPSEEMIAALQEWASCAGYIPEGWSAAITAALAGEGGV